LEKDKLEPKFTTTSELKALIEKEREQALKASEFNVQKLNERHRYIMRLLLLGKTNKEIAKITGYSAGRVSTIINSPNFQETYAAFRYSVDKEFERKFAQDIVEDPVKKLLKDNAEEAMRHNIYLMKEAESEVTQQKSVFDILDRAGYKPRDQVTLEGSLTLDDVTANNINQALMDLGVVKEEIPSGGQEES